MMRPPLPESIMCGATALVVRNTAVVLMAKKWSQTSFSSWVTGTLSLPMIARALLTRMSIRPNWSMVCCTICSIACGSERSQ